MSETALGTVVGNLADAAPHRTALTCGTDTVSRAALETRSHRLARAYRELGVTPDSFVTIGLPNGIEFFEAVLAAARRATGEGPC
jgi:bile acid-coenzyme A ligase